MNISWYGEGCFKIQVSEVTILTDPFEKDSGLTPPRIQADIVVKTLSSIGAVDARNNTAVVSGAGEYNIKGVGVLGLTLAEESTNKFIKTAYFALADGIGVFILGHISSPPSQSILEQASSVDILIIPAGDKPFIDIASAVKLIKQIGPKIVLPSFFKVAGLKRQTSDIKGFISALGDKNIDYQQKLSLRKKELTEIKSTKVVVLKV